MSSADFSTVLVKDDRIANLTDKIVYAVNKGAQQVTVAEFAATSESNTSHVYNIVVPSLETVIDRRVNWTSTVTLEINATCAADKQPVNYGVRDALGPFPLHQLVNTMTATINNNTVSMNTKDILPAMLRMLENRELAKYNNSTPVAYDTYLNYSDMAGTNNNSFGGYSVVGPDNDIQPRGSFALDEVYAIDGAGAKVAVPVSAGAAATYYVRFTVTEPLLLSPFLFANPKTNNQGIYGIQNMSFTMTMGDTSRVWRHYNNTSVTDINSVRLVSFQTSKLSFNFLSLHPSDSISSRCVVPFYEMPRYIQSNLPPIGARTGGNGLNGLAVNPGVATYSSSTISLNQIPDKLIIYLRKSIRTWTDSDSFLPITKININWNNNSGVCNSFNVVDLWKASVEAGSNQSFNEFRGYAFSASTNAEEKTAGSGAGKLIPTCGSVLMLDMGQHVNLVEDFYAPGSIGQFSFQIAVTCANYSADPVTPELVVIAMNSGSFATERGTSSTFVALLDKETVLQTSQTEPVSRGEVRRLVGGGFLDSLKSAFKWLLPHAGKIANTALTVHDIYKDGPTHKSTKARHIVKALGGSRSGGAMSGGLMSRLK
jgi:hypothetical protein